MQHIISHSEVAGYIHSDYYTIPKSAHQHTSLQARFFRWCASQEESRFMWLVLAYLGQIGLALPCTLFAIIFLGSNNFPLLVAACVINVPVLAIHLAAQPTKITLPALFFAWLADAVIILYCATLFLIK